MAEYKALTDAEKLDEEEYAKQEKREWGYKIDDPRLASSVGDFLEVERKPKPDINLSGNDE